MPESKLRSKSKPKLESKLHTKSTSKYRSRRCSKFHHKCCSKLVILLIQVLLHQVLSPLSFVDKSLLTPIRQTTIPSIPSYCRFRSRQQHHRCTILTSPTTVIQFLTTHQVFISRIFFHDMLGVVPRNVPNFTSSTIPSCSVFNSSTVTSSYFSHLNTSLLPPLRQQIYPHFCCSQKTTQVSMSFSVVVHATNYIISFMIQE